MKVLENDYFEVVNNMFENDSIEDIGYVGENRYLITMKEIDKVLIVQITKVRGFYTPNRRTLGTIFKVDFLEDLNSDKVIATKNVILDDDDALYLGLGDKLDINDVKNDIENKPLTSYIPLLNTIVKDGDIQLLYEDNNLIENVELIYNKYLPTWKYDNMLNIRLAFIYRENKYINLDITADLKERTYDLGISIYNRYRNIDENIQITVEHSPYENKIDIRDILKSADELKDYKESILKNQVKR